MAYIKKKHEENFEELKDMVETSQEYFQENYNRFNEFSIFTCSTALTEEEKSKLQILKKPPIEANSLEAYVSTLLSDFSKQMPGFIVRASDCVPQGALNKNFVKTIEVVEGYIKESWLNSTNDFMRYHVMREMLIGGFSVMEVYTDYVSEMSFDQKICIDRVFESTLCGFDPMARESHKGDGLYCFQVFPMRRKEFEEKYGKERTQNMGFTRNIGGFNWSYKNEREDIVLVVVFYKKHKKRVRIVKLSNGKVVTAKKYDAFVEAWKQSGAIEQVPIVVETRLTKIDTIYRYDLCETCILSCVKTQYKYLPFVFFDGNSVMVKETTNGASKQMTRPYVYHAKGMQKLKNFAMQSQAQEIEALVQHKFIAALESIPEDYMDAYINPQNASTLVYNAFFKDDPDKPMPSPREVQRPQTPPIIMQTFSESDRMIQSILGSYDAQLGIQGNNLSGKAIQQGAMHSSGASAPYLMGYLRGISRVCEIMVDLIPKYYVTPRSLPIIKKDGKRDYVLINHDNVVDSIFMNYDPSLLEIVIEPGVNSEVKKQVSLQQIIQLSQASPVFQQFINEKGLDILVDNLDINGIEVLKLKAAEFMEGLAEAKKMQSLEKKSDPFQIQKEIEFNKIARSRERDEQDYSIKTAELALKKQAEDTEFVKVLSSIGNEDRNMALKQQSIDAEQTRTAVDSAIAMNKHKHDVVMEKLRHQNRPQEYSWEERPGRGLLD